MVHPPRRGLVAHRRGDPMTELTLVCASANPHKVGEILELTGLGNCADLDVRQLSAGQKRRAALARILLSRAELWLLDEPQTNLDVAGRQAVEAAIRGHLGQGGTVVVAAHQALDLGSASVSRLKLGEA